MCNTLGGGPIQRKDADSGFKRIGDRLPFLQFEAGFNSFFLLIEAAMWLNEASMTQFVCAICPVKEKLFVFFIERRTKSDPKLTTLALVRKLTENHMKRKAHIKHVESIATEEILEMSTEDLNSIFEFQIIDRFSFDMEKREKCTMKIPLSKIDHVEDVEIDFQELCRNIDWRNPGL